MKQRRPRRGAVSVEFAFVAPLLFLFVFAGIEFSRVNLIRNTLKNASYEGARRGVVPGATAADCIAASQELLDLVFVSGSTIDVSPAVIAPETDEITVSISLPLDTNGYIAPHFFAGRALTSSVTLPREQD